jgi:hypothetical protein
MLFFLTKPERQRRKLAAFPQNLSNERILNDGKKNNSRRSKKQNFFQRQCRFVLQLSLRMFIIDHNTRRILNVARAASEATPFGAKRRIHKQSL